MEEYHNGGTKEEKDDEGMGEFRKMWVGVGYWNAWSLGGGRRDEWKKETIFTWTDGGKDREFWKCYE